MAQKGYILNLCVTGDDPGRVSDAINILINSRASGVIVSSMNHELCKKDFARARHYMSIVSIQGDVEQVDRIDTTDEKGTYEIISHLIANGHRKIGFIGYNYHVSILASRLKGYKRALLDHQIEINPNYICDGEQSYESGYQMAASLLKRKDPPTAIP